MKQKINLVYVCNILLMLKSVKKASKNLIYISLMSLMYSHVMHDEIWRKKSSWIRPLDPNKPALNFFSTCWNVPDGDETFLFRFRFRREHFGDLMTQLNFFDDNNNIRYLKYGNIGHHHLCRLDTALMIVTRRLAYPNRCGDLVNEFNL